MGQKYVPNMGTMEGWIKPVDGQNPAPLGIRETIVCWYLQGTPPARVSQVVRNGFRPSAGEVLCPLPLAGESHHLPSLRRKGAEESGPTAIRHAHH